MPIYEYVCPSCNSKFELLRLMSRANNGASCPRCHKTAERILSTFASFSKSDNGQISSTGGSSCASCRAASCDSCSL